MTSERERFAVMHQFGRTYRAFMAAFEAHVGQPMPRWRILLALHDRLKVEIPESDYARLVTLNDVVAYLARASGSPPPS